MIELIPAIDIIDGKCVRLSQGDYSSKQIYHTHPVEVAKEFESYGIKRLHIVDLDGAGISLSIKASFFSTVHETNSTTNKDKYHQFFIAFTNNNKSLNF